MEIQDLLKNIWRKRWMLFVVTLAGVCFTIILLQFKTDQYTSSTRVSTGFTLDDKITLNEETKNNKSGETKFSNLLALMKSPTSYNLLSYRLLLHDLKAMNGFNSPKDVSANLEEDNLKKLIMLVNRKIENLYRGKEMDIHSLYTDKQIDKVISILEYKLEHKEPLYSNEPDFELIRQFLMSYGYDFKKIQEALSIQRVRDTDYVEISFTSSNRYLSAFGANTFCTEFIEYYATMKGENTSESAIVLNKVVQQKKDSLDSKLEVLKRYKTSEIPDANHANVTRYDQMVELETKRDEIESRIKELELTINRLQEDLRGSGNIKTGNQEIIALQQRIKDLNRRYINSGSDDQNLADSLKYLRIQLRSAISTTNQQEDYSSKVADIQGKIKDANIDYEVENNKLKQVNKRISNIRYGLSNNRSAEDQIASLENEINVARQEYLQVLNKYNDAKDQQVLLNPLKQILKATPAITPSSMPDIFIVLISLAGSFGFGLFIAILMTITDERIRNSSRFKQMVDLPLLSVVNELKLGRKSLPNPRKIFKSKHNKTSHEIEYYKSAIRDLRFQLESTNQKVILFTSLRNKVGKSSIICSLSYTLSLLKKRVLIIDTNFKSNTLTRIFGVGLKEIKVVHPRMLISKVKPVNAVMENGDINEETEKTSSSLDLVNNTQYENVFFIGNSGVKGLSPVELLSKKDFKVFIQRMSEQFDYILLEGPALNDYADSKELTEFAQKVITVVSADSEIAPIDEQSLRFVNSLNGKAGGAILNRVSATDIRD